jgi:hypothetical protein
MTQDENLIGKNPSDKVVESTREILFLFDKHTTLEWIFCENNDGNQSYKYHFCPFVHNKLWIHQRDQFNKLSLISNEIKKILLITFWLMIKEEKLI